jgi:benzoate membrane transport protein
VVCGALLVVAGLWTQLGRWLRAIPAPLSAALLAGVLLPVCLTPAQAAVEVPAQALPMIAVWALLTRFARQWAVPAALVVAAVAVALDPVPGASDSAGLAPSLQLTAPAFGAGALVGIALPLFVVTMASQNVPGMSVLTSFGYRPELRPVLVSTGVATAVSAPFGGHAVNLAAITAALVAGPEAHPDPARRWIASAAMGGVYLVLGLGAGLATLLVAAAPPVLIEAVAGLALLATLGASLSAALAEPEHRDAALITFTVTASAITAVGVSASFWGLTAGLAFKALRRRDIAA